jgi:hypothetical protein
MTWDRSKVIALASQKCAYCYGLGLREAARGAKQAICGCVLRAIFNACYRRFRACSEDPGKIGRVTIDRLIEQGNSYGAKPSVSGKRGTRAWGMKQQEYAADFVLIAKRTLGEATQAYKFFRIVFLLGADYRLACPKLGLEPGRFWHEKYRIEEALGRVLAETEPHPLWPIDEYFGLHKKADRAVHPLLRVDSEPEPARVGRPLKYPVAKAA